LLLSFGFFPNLGRPSPLSSDVSHSFFKLLAKLAESFVFVYLGMAMFTFKLVCARPGGGGLSRTPIHGESSNQK